MAELVCGTGDREAWLAARREGITATDIAVIMGLVSWDSPFALYWRKKGVLPPTEETDRMRLGSWLEDQVAMEWNAQHDPDGSEGLTGGGLYRSEARPWQLATPDYLTWSGGVLECKTSSTRDGWGEDGTASVPAHVRAQVLWQMDTLDVGAGHVAVVFLPSGEFRSYTISHDEDEQGPDGCQACADLDIMRNEGELFMQRLQNDDPPPVDGSPPTTDALRFLHAGVVKGKRAEIHKDLAEKYEFACAQVKEWTASKKEAENLIRDEMDDAALAVSLDRVIARREVFKNPGYQVAPHEVDRLVRVKPKETGNG